MHNDMKARCATISLALALAAACAHAAEFSHWLSVSFDGYDDGETLTVDTGDLDTGDGHATAITSALTADALVKTGAGSLTLGSADNAIGDMQVQMGTLALAASQAFGSLSFAPSTALRLDAAGVTVTAEGSLDLTGVELQMSAAARASLGNGWETVLSVPAGQTLVGLPTLASANCAARIVETEGGFALQVRNKPGSVFTIR